MNQYVFKLFITGQTARSEMAIANLRHICDRWFGGQCQIVVIDVLEQPEEAELEHIMATPTLIKQYPPPVQRIIGDLSDLEKVRANLGFTPA
jgi:circadian clock protein KaiB